VIVQADVKGLEIVVAAWLSQDKVLLGELNSGVDIHSENERTFGLPSRGIAKILKFRILYGGNEYSFVNDPDFTSVSSSERYWKKVIEKYYEKYSGIANWHDKMIRQVATTGKIISPFGRTFAWDLKADGNLKLPSTQIKNYIVQGTGADIVAIARVSLFRRWKQAGINGVIINTVHDSICFDVHKDEVNATIELINGVFRDVPANINRIFNLDFNLETKVEVLVGDNMYDLNEWNSI